MFLADPTARADKVADDYVTIAGYDFRGAEDSMVVEARARFAADQENLRSANRATLAAWINQHDTNNQKQRLVAGLLPWPEAYESLEKQLYPPLKMCRRYERFALQDVCECQREDGTFCKVKCKSVDAASLTADSSRR